MNKVHHIGCNQIIIASYYHDSAQPIEFENREATLHSGDSAGEVRIYARKREFDTSPSGGDGGNRTGAAEPQWKPGVRPVLRHYSATAGDWIMAARGPAPPPLIPLRPCATLASERGCPRWRSSCQ